MEHFSIYHVEMVRVWLNCKPMETWQFTETDRHCKESINQRSSQELLITLQRSTAHVGDSVHPDNYWSDFNGRVAEHC